jgi:phosphoribulokinase
MPDLKGPEGNAFVLLGRADRALADIGMNKEERKFFHDQAKASDYENLLATIMEWFIVVAAKTEYVVINGAVDELGKSSSEKE